MIVRHDDRGNGRCGVGLGWAGLGRGGFGICFDWVGSYCWEASRYWNMFSNVMIRLG